MTYTPEMTQSLISLYKSDYSFAEIAEQLGVPERSVIAKLSALGLYRRKPYQSKTGEPPVKKEVYVNRILDALGIDHLLGDSLEKCNKFILKAIADALCEKNG